MPGVPIGRTAALLASVVLTAGAERAAAQTAPAAARASASAIAAARADSARLPYTAADVRFMTAMIGHHSQAIAMARLAPTHGASAEVRTLAARIANAQRDEIATMAEWLRDREKPVPALDTTIAASAAAHAGHGAPSAPGAHSGHGAHGARVAAGSAAGSSAAPGGDHASMPGMLTPAQLQQLDAARGEEFDRLFLTLMIQHHRGAVTMVQELFATDGAAQNEGVFRLASDVNVDQITEIARMEQMLLARMFERPAP
jgi:uncharacterized protein (DUF305 family)